MGKRRGKNPIAKALRALGTRGGAQRAARARWAGVAEEKRMEIMKLVREAKAKKRKKKR